MGHIGYTCFLFQFTAFFILNIIGLISSIVGRIPESEIQLLTPWGVFILLIFNPIIEEYIFRKLLAEKLLEEGEKFYIFASSFCFAIVHGVSQGVPQIIYTFILGLIWSYLYVKTGYLKIPILFHAVSNFFGGILVQLLESISLEALGVYGLFAMLMGLLGFIVFIKIKKDIILDKEKGFFSKDILIDLISNKGILVYAVVTSIFMILKFLYL